ncbi:MAG: type II toxin-antitoxin system RelE/ParE family toxin [Armatimonadetes bacterium]|nr:type II toxin-antitoxin system RelE/ParE family toxin [Armatimonadota bacterium]
MLYDLRINKKVVKQVAHLDAKIFRQVLMRILELGQNPRPHDSEELKGYHDPEVAGRKGFRLDQGEYRVLYTVDEKQRKVIVFRVGHRREVYRE